MGLLFDVPCSRRGNLRLALILGWGSAVGIVGSRGRSRHRIMSSPVLHSFPSGSIWLKIYPFCPMDYANAISFSLS